MPRYRATVFGKTVDAMADLVRVYHVNLAGHTGKRVGSKQFTVDVLADDEQPAQLRDAGYEIDVHEDVHEAGKRRQAEVRQPGVRAAATTVAAADHYLNVDDIESALANAAAANPAITQRFELPNKTWEGRTCHAIKIAKGNQANRPGIYFIGGVHAREWGSPDILIHFIEQLCEAYRTHSGITIGNAKVTADQIRQIVETKDVYVFPQSNPDGRHHSMTVAPDWRKNRRPAAGGGINPNCVGVDLNRNFDFLWDFKKHFAPNAPVRNSTNPCDPEIYVGPAPFSEPETKNAAWLFDQFPNIRFFIDVHSYSEDILYNWGDDQNQTQSAQMNFRNAAFDGKRGVPNDTKYKEFIPSADKTTAVKLANRMRTAIAAVRGRDYTVMQSMSLYPTAGSSDDYAFSRHLVDAAKAKVFSYTIEWGSGENETPFHPPYPEMKQIIQ